MSLKSVVTIFAVASVFLVGFTGGPAVDVKAEADAIRKLENEWDLAIRAKDVNKILNYFAPDAVSMPANKPMVSGIQAIRKAEDASFADTTSDYKTYSSKVDVVEVSTSGDLAMARGTDHMNKKTAKGQDVETGKWIDVWKKTDGKWKVIASTWNSDKPEPKN